jgi:hypothetical protein
MVVAIEGVKEVPDGHSAGAGARDCQTSGAMQSAVSFRQLLTAWLTR